MSEPKSLEEQLSELKTENAKLLSMNRQLEWAMKHIEAGHVKSWDAASSAHCYLLTKIERQAACIRRLQWNGWEPELVIKEEEDVHAA